MFDAILIPFITIAIAEMFDKSQLSILLLSSRTRHHLQLLLGVIAAFILVNGAAILVGAFAPQLIPASLLKMLSGVIFIIFGVRELLSHAEKEQVKELSVKNAVISGFSLVFLSEWGDKTQLASAIFATQYPAFFVFIGVITALILLSILAVYLGKLIAGKINKKLLSRISGILFILLGIFFLLPL